MELKEFRQVVAELLDWYVYRPIDPRNGCTFYGDLFNVYL